jgi:hypothetical protein
MGCSAIRWRVSHAPIFTTPGLLGIPSPPMKAPSKPRVAARLRHGDMAMGTCACRRIPRFVPADPAANMMRDVRIALLTVFAAVPVHPRKE